MNFLTSYTVLMTREDIDRTDEERRRKNRWVTDAIFIVEVLMFIVTNTARTITIYDASNLHHIPLWLILGTPTILHCLTHSFSKKQCVLYAGNECGEMIDIHFLQPNASLLRKKHNDKMTLFYWQELKNEKDFVAIKITTRIHSDYIRHIEYLPDNDTIVTCSRDMEKSVIVKSVDNRIKPYIFKIKRGTSCFDVSRKMKIIVTGSEDGTIRIWNLVIVSNPLFTLTSHRHGIMEVVIFESQKLLISVSRDGILKLWDLKEYTCIKSIKIKFPPFKEMGKTVEWGKNCIFPGPKRENSMDAAEISMSPNEKQWDRTNILVSCCNYVASIRFNFLNEEDQNFDLPVLPPPPLQSSVLIPTTWKVSDENSEVKVELIEIDDKIKSYIESLNFILDKDLLSDGTLNNEINFKIAQLESKKVTMRGAVSQGAPYLALDLQDIEEITLSPNLPVPIKKKNRQFMERTQKILSDVGLRSIIFSTPSSSTRSRSSRTSVIEFD